MPMLDVADIRASGALTTSLVPTGCRSCCSLDCCRLCCSLDCCRLCCSLDCSRLCSRCAVGGTMAGRATASSPPWGAAAAVAEGKLGTSSSSYCASSAANSSTSASSSSSSTTASPRPLAADSGFLAPGRLACVLPRPLPPRRIERWSFGAAPEEDEPPGRPRKSPMASLAREALKLPTWGASPTWPLRRATSPKISLRRCSACARSARRSWMCAWFSWTRTARAFICSASCSRARLSSSSPAPSCATEASAPRREPCGATAEAAVCVVVGGVVAVAGTGTPTGESCLC
mmetsp:Transcript_65157/g.187285  ORF Transcript_65157/g.187285 Transcript_65157/m.187285 type:complete len:289 (+) Transcript_65157:1992-2858(+)